MAWKEQCKIAFRMTADGLLFKEKNRKGIVKILRQLAKESDIPFNTLRNWYYEKQQSVTENGNDVIIENNIENNTGGLENDTNRLPICTRCGKNPVQIINNKKPVGPGSKYYGLCQMCAKRQHFVEMSDTNAEQDPRFMTVCPKCSNVYYIQKERLSKSAFNNHHNKKVATKGG